MTRNKDRDAIRLTITHHAVEAFKTRFPCNPGKYAKIAMKALRSKEPILDGDVTNQRFYEKEKYPDAFIVYRKFMGRIFVFGTRPGEAILVTLYPANMRTKQKRQTVLPQTKRP